MSGARATPGYWYLTYCGERYRRVMGPDGRNLHDELSGVPVAKSWVAPEYKIVGTGSWPDWMAYLVPLLSKKGMSSLAELLAPHCEFLPWIHEAEHEYMLVNVITQIPRDNWSCEKSSVYNDIYAAADVISLRDVDIPHLFRLQGYRGKTFVSDAVAQRSVACGLKGAVFVHPSIPELHLGFIPLRFGRKGTGFIWPEDDLASGEIRHIH